MSEPRTADALAEAAIAGIESGMLVGFGAGRTTARAIQLLGERVKSDPASHSDIKVVTVTSKAEEMCRAAGLTVIDFADIEELDILVDGADEVDPQLRMLKGSGGAMTRERIIAWSAHTRRYIVPGHKLVDALGTESSLSIAVMYFGLASTRSAMRGLGINGLVRRDLSGEPFVTENGNIILDATIDREHGDLEELAAALNDIPGVIDHGLFLHEADEILVDEGDTVRRLVRTDDD